MPDKKTNVKVIDITTYFFASNGAIRQTGYEAGMTFGFPDTVGTPDFSLPGDYVLGCLG